jgi:hypothetical protein
VKKIKKHEVRVGSNGITFITTFVKIGQLVQELKGDTHARAHTHGMVTSYAHLFSKLGSKGPKNMASELCNSKYKCKYKHYSTFGMNISFTVLLQFTVYPETLHTKTQNEYYIIKTMT